MKRWVFELAAGLSLALCLAASLLWLRAPSGQAWAPADKDGAFRMDQLSRTPPPRESGRWLSVEVPIFQVLFGKAGAWECEAKVASDRTIFFGYIKYPPRKTPVRLPPGVDELVQDMGLQPPKHGEWFWYRRPHAAFHLARFRVEAVLAMIGYRPSGLRYSADTGMCLGLEYPAGTVLMKPRMYEFPIWVLVATFAILPIGRTVLFYRRRRRVAHGACVTCGYDLRATPERCPECGTPSGVT
jgi:hypothetical protein